MRRQDRQVTDISEINAIINRCCVCRLGMTDGLVPYVVPLNFGCEFDSERLILYFHCAREGRKLDIIRANPLVCFEMDGGGELLSGDRACNYSYRYESVIGSGTAVIIEDTDEKIRALKLIMLCVTGSGDFDITPGEAQGVAVIRVTADEYTAKRH